MVCLFYPFQKHVRQALLFYEACQLELANFFPTWGFPLLFSVLPCEMLLRPLFPPPLNPPHFVKVFPTLLCPRFRARCSLRFVCLRLSSFYTLFRLLSAPFRSFSGMRMPLKFTPRSLLLFCFFESSLRLFGPNTSLPAGSGKLSHWPR